MRRFAACLLLLVSSLSLADEGNPGPQDLDHFEQKIRPLLVKHCYECHSSEAKTLHAGLRLDSAEGLQQGGDSGPVVDASHVNLRHHKRRHLIVVMDRAPPHTSKKTRSWIGTQPRLHVFHLPAYSPDWNPDEKVWNYLKHTELASHQAKNKSELKQLARRKLHSMNPTPNGH